MLTNEELIKLHSEISEKYEKAGGEPMVDSAVDKLDKDEFEQMLKSLGFKEVLL